MRRSGSEFNPKSISSFSGESTATTTGRTPLFASLSQKSNDLRVFTFSEDKASTKRFSRSLVVGEGGFGCIYKGIIKSSEDPENKLTVPVKQLGKRGLQGHKERVTEVNVLGVVEHPNLVKLIGYCVDDDERGIQCILIYKYMPNRNVEDHPSSIMGYKIKSSPGCCSWPSISPRGDGISGIMGYAALEYMQRWRLTVKGGVWSYMV